MMAVRLNIEERKFSVKCHWKYENTVEVQRQFRGEHQKEPPSDHRVTMTETRDQFEAYGTVQKVHRKSSRRPLTWTKPHKERGAEM